MTTAELSATNPEDLGIDSEKLEAVFARAKRDVDDGTLKSAQVAVARHGRLAGVRTFGTVCHNGSHDEVPATNDTLYTIFSSTKAIVGAAIWTVCEDGLLKIEEKVSDIIPEFGSNGKENITVEQVMLHIAGFPMAPFSALEWDNRERRLARFNKWRLNWEPGTKFEYHATGAHWTLAEIIERRTGKDFRTYVRERILDPMGLSNLYIGLPAELNGRVADVRHIVPPASPPGGWGEVTPDAILSFNRPETRAVGVPGGGGIAGAAQLALFYQPLVNGGETADGTRIMKAETIEWATTPRTKGLPPRPQLQPTRESRTHRGRGRRRRQLAHPRVRQYGFAEGVRPRRSGWPNRLGRPGNWHLARLLHRRLPGRPHSAPSRRCDQQLGWELPRLVPRCEPRR